MVEETRRRDVRRVTPSVSSFPKDIKLWAVIVGISEYRHKPWNLKFARRDAEDLYNLIQQPWVSGWYKEKHIKFLIDEKATTLAIYSALRSFLRQPVEEDIVLLYFACHGTDDIERDNNSYLLTYDTEPNDIFATGIPFREIIDALHITLKAKRVIILMDTCYSGALYPDGRRNKSVSPKEINNLLKEKLSHTKEGVAILTSARAYQASREGREWGEGHGVFTYYVLKGLNGEADKLSNIDIA